MGARDACIRAIEIRTRELKQRRSDRRRTVAAYPSVSPESIERKAKRYLQENIGMTRGVTLYCATLMRAVYARGNKGAPWAPGYFESRMRVLARCVRGCKTPREAASVIIGDSDKRISPFVWYEKRVQLWREYD